MSQIRSSLHGVCRVLLKTVAVGALAPGGLWGADLVGGRLPEEYESMGGHGLSLNNAAVASTDGAAAVRTNPSLLAKQKSYTVTGGYHWPTVGREFYQAAIVDGKTSKIAAGFSYTSFMEDYKYYRIDERSSPWDSPITKRAAIGAGQGIIDGWFLGIGATYIESSPLWSDLVLNPNQIDNPEKRRGFGVNFGISTNLGQNIDLGAAIENATNQKINSYLPQTIRVGAAFRWFPEAQFLIDYKQRERVPEFESKQMTSLEALTTREKLAPEQMILAGVEAQAYDVIRLSGSYGHALGEYKRSVAAGVAVVNRGFSIAYAWSRPFLNEVSTHQAVSLSLDVTI